MTDAESHPKSFVHDDVLAVVASNLIDPEMRFNPSAGVPYTVWTGAVTRLNREAHQISAKLPNCPVDQILAFLVSAARDGEAPESVATDFIRNVPTGLELNEADKRLLILTANSNEGPHDFAPMPLGERHQMGDNVRKAWFTLAQNAHHLRRALTLHSQAHLNAAERMFEQREVFHNDRSTMHRDGAATHPRPASLARLEMDDILRLRLAGDRLLTFFIWWSIIGDVGVAQRLARLYQNPKQAEDDAARVFKRQIFGPIPHDEVNPVFCFRDEPLYFLHGVCVPSAVVTTSAADINPKLVLSTRNPAVRDAIVGKIGLGRTLSALGTLMEMVDEYELWGLSLPDKQVRVLRIEDRFVEDGKVPGVWWEAVPSDCQSIRDCIIFRNRNAFEEGEVPGVPMFIT